MPDPNDPAVVATDAYIDALADDLPVDGDRLERAITEWRDESREGTR
jgi:hypothetical protein